MPASFGGIACDFVRMRDRRDLTQRMRNWTMPGWSGTGAQKLGKSNGGVVIELIKFGAKLDVETWIDQVEALSATKVTVIDDRETTYQNILMGEPRPEVKSIKRPDQPTHDTRGFIVVSGRVT